LEDEDSQKEWLKHSSLGIQNEETKEQIRRYLQTKKENEKETDFKSLYEKIKADYCQHSLSDDEKDKLWNFTLLDSLTNSSYGNAIFPAKRRVVIGKDQGIKYVVSDDLEAEEIPGTIAFVPPCTKHVFLKYFNHSTNNLREWDKQDAEAYLENIKKTILEVLEEKEVKNGK
jgi:hypothetical protein